MNFKSYKSLLLKLILFSMVVSIYSCSEDDINNLNEDNILNKEELVITEFDPFKNEFFKNENLNTDVQSNWDDNITNKELDPNDPINPNPIVLRYIDGAFQSAPIYSDLIMPIQENQLGLPAGLYVYDVYKYSAIVNLPPNYEGRAETVSPEGYVSFTPSTNTFIMGPVTANYNADSFAMYTYIIKIKKQYGMNHSLNLWYPFKPANHPTVRFGYKIRPIVPW